MDSPLLLGQLKLTNIRFCVDTEWNLEDLLGAMNERNRGWKERERGKWGSCRTLYCQFDEKIRRKCSKHVNNIMSVMGDNLFIQIFDKPHQPDDGWWLSRPSILCSMMMMIHSSMINFINLVCNIPFIFIFIFTTVKSWISFYCSSHLAEINIIFLPN